MNSQTTQTVILTEDEKDVLQELMNVAYGSAASVVAQMLDAFASLSIPKIEIMLTSELLEEFKKLKDSSYFFSTQAFIGEFSGESAFFIDDASAKNLAKHLGLETQDDIDDAILELTNVLTSSLTTRLSKEMGTEVSFALPSITKLGLSDISQSDTFIQYSRVIVIETAINFEDQMISGEIFILTKDGSIQWLKKRLSEIVETLM